MSKDKKLNEWYQSYLKNFAKRKRKTKKISKHMLNFLIWFSDINLPLSQILNPLLIKILHEELKLDSYESFRTRLIPALLNQLIGEIDIILKNSHSICLIPDGWKCPITKGEYLGLASIVMDCKFIKRVILIGLTELENGHSAEETRNAIERIVNQFSFDKSKIIGSLSYYFGEV